MELNDKNLLDIYNDISISQVKSDVAFRTLVDCVNENMYIVPEYQRKFRWSKQKIENLAASLIKGLPIPPIYTYRNDENQLEILDGQQRVMSLFMYFHGKIMGNERSPFFDYQNLKITNTFIEALENTTQLKDCKYEMYIDGKRYNIAYNDLPIKIKRKVDYVPITIIEIKIESEINKDKILHKIFANLNREGERLSEQELRNGIYPCEFYNMLYDVNKNSKKWRKIYGSVDRKGKDIELLLRLCALRKNVKFSREKEVFIVKKYENSLLDYFSEEVIGFGAKECKEYRNSLEQFFQKFEITKCCKKATLLDSVYMVLEKTEVDCIITDKVCESISNAGGFSAASLQGTMSSSNMKRRWKIAYEQLSKYTQ